MSSYDKTAYSELKSAQPSGFEALLLEYNANGAASKILWRFLKKPSRVDFSNTATHTAIATHAAKVTHRHYGYTEGETWKIGGLQLHTFWEGKSLGSVYDGLMRLLEAREDFNTPLLLFRMGAREFAPCKLTEVSGGIDAWLGGELAGIADLGLTLIKVPKPLSPAEKEAREKAQKEELAAIAKEQSKPPTKLSDRLIKEAEDKAKEYLVKNLAAWSDATQISVKQTKFKLTCNPDTGDVTMLTDAGKVGIVGRFDGTTLNTGKGFTTIPIKDKTKAAP